MAASLCGVGERVFAALELSIGQAADKSQMSRAGHLMGFVAVVRRVASQQM